VISGEINQELYASSPDSGKKAPVKTSFNRLPHKLKQIMPSNGTLLDLIYSSRVGQALILQWRGTRVEYLLLFRHQ
jgi:hypothetical protein